MTTNGDGCPPPQGTTNTAKHNTPKAPQSTPILDQAFDAGSLYTLRAAVAAHATQAGLTPGRADDLVIAVHELAANAVRHGAGHGRLRIWRSDQALRCEITDDGLPDAKDAQDAHQTSAKAPRVAHRARPRPVPGPPGRRSHQPELGPRRHLGHHQLRPGRRRPAVQPGPAPSRRLPRPDRHRPPRPSLGRRVQPHHSRPAQRKRKRQRQADPGPGQPGRLGLGRPGRPDHRAAAGQRHPGRPDDPGRPPRPPRAAPPRGNLNDRFTLADSPATAAKTI